MCIDIFKEVFFKIYLFFQLQISILILACSWFFLNILCRCHFWLSGIKYFLWNMLIFAHIKGTFDAIKRKTKSFKNFPGETFISKEYKTWIAFKVEPSDFNALAVALQSLLQGLVITLQIVQDPHYSLFLPFLHILKVLI